jgi:hypothetical protein
MINADEIDETGQKFLIHVYERAGGDSSAQISMYEIGAGLGLQRDNASKVAQELIGLQLIEIRTLSGGIGITADGSRVAQELTGGPAANDPESVNLGDDPLLNLPRRQAVEQMALALKNQSGALGLGFETLTELVADLKTVDAQLESPRPKTAIIKACLTSILNVLQNCGENTISSRIRALMGIS